jgi:hypothetical protein
MRRRTYNPAMKLASLEAIVIAVDSAKARQSWITEKGMVVFQLHSSRHPDTTIDLFVTEPFEFDAEYDRALVGELEVAAGEFMSASQKPSDQPDADAAWESHNLAQLLYFRSLSLREKFEAVQGMADIARRFQEMREQKRFIAQD